MRRTYRACVVALAMVALGLTAAPGASAAEPQGIHKIQHVIVIMQENRSFDSYFGTYPGANGIPAGTCVPDPLHGGCIAPFHDPDDQNWGGPHGSEAAAADIDGGKMDGFVGQAEKGLNCSSTQPDCSPCNTLDAESSKTCDDVMGYHDAREIPNYWTYAQNFVLQDNMFASTASYSLPEHLFMVSAWSADCPYGDSNPMACVNSLFPPDPEYKPDTTYAWTDITYLLHKAGISWGYYIFEGEEPDCENNEAMSCAPVKQGPTTPSIWNPLPEFTDVKEDGQLGNIQSLSNFYTAAREKSGCSLPNVSWIGPNATVSEHPPYLISTGQAYVTTLINTIMRSPCWGSTAIFLSWDDWGGFYDNVVPPSIDENGYGIRVPGLVISPYARAGYIDHQQLSHDAYLKFIEDDFLDRQRLNPQTDGRPDRRPDVREEAPGLGNLENDFNFNQTPRLPLLLPVEPAPGPASCPPGLVPSALRSPCLTSASPALPTHPAAPPVTPLALQFVASVAPRQDLRLNHGRIYLMVGCNMACWLYAHGHLNLTRRRRHLGLRSVHSTLNAHRTVGISLSLSLSRRNLSAVRRALREHRPVKASIEVQATGVGGLSQSYQVNVVLTWR